MKSLLTIAILLLANSLFAQTDFIRKQMEKAHPTPMSEKERENIPPWLTNEPTPNPSNFDNYNTITEMESGTPTQNESSIAINPTDPLNLIASAVDYRDDGARYVYVSQDGGATWENYNLGFANNTWRSSNDPSVYFDNEGTAYLMYGAFGNGGENGIFVSRSTDKGVTWDAHLPVIQHVGLQTPDSAFEDKYYIEVDQGKNSPYEGYIYTPWKRVIERDSATQIMFSRSTNGGYEWSEPVALSPRKPGTSEDTTYGQSFPLLSTGPNGELYAVWNDGIVHGVGFNRSFDGGETWEEPRIIHNYEIFGTTQFLQRQGGYRHSLKGIVRAEAYPVIMSDYTDLETSGNLYVSWAADSLPNIYFSKSTDQGLTWTDPIIVHSDQSNDQFWHWMKIDPFSGHIAIMYLDSRNDPDNIWVEAWVSLSTNAGETWVDRQVSDFVFDLRRNPFGGEFAGDYSGCEFYNGIIYPSWVDMRNEDAPLGADNDVYTAIVNTKAPKPVNDLEAFTIPERPTEIDMTWTIDLESTFGIQLEQEEVKIEIFRDNNFLTELGSDQTTYTDTDLIAFQEYKYDVFVVSNNERSAIRTTSAYAGGSFKPAPAKIVDYDPQYELESISIEIELPTLRDDGVTPLVNLSGFNLYRDGEFLSDFLIDKSQAGTTVSISDDETEPNNFYKYQVEIIADYNDGSPRQFSDKSNEVLIWSGGLFESVREDFEEEPQYVYNTGNWKQNTSHVYSGNYSYSSSEGLTYFDNQSDTLIFPPVTTSIIPEARLRLLMYHSAILQRGDVAQILVSGNDMKSFDLVAEFDKFSYDVWDDDELKDNDWILEDINLTEFLVKNNEMPDHFYLSLVFNSNNFREAEGWFVDELGALPVGVKDQQTSEFTIFPNPVNNRLNLIGEFTSNTKVELIDLSGRLIELDYNITDSVISINTSSLNSGVYIIKVNSSTQKFVKF